MKLCGIALSVVTICLIFNNCSGRTSKELRVTLPNGSKLVGRYLRSHDGKGIRAFMGVPYAEPPVGDLRFRYVGLWYYQEMMPFDGTENAECYESRYKLNGSENLTIRDRYYDPVYKKYDGTSFDEWTSGKPGTGFYYFSKYTEEFIADNQVTILATDYYSYSVECLCSYEGPAASTTYCYSMTRGRIDIDKKTMRKIKQDDKTCVKGGGGWYIGYRWCSTWLKFKQRQRYICNLVNSIEFHL